MLWFNTNIGAYLSAYLRFQYILCCGSTILIQKVWYLLVKFQYILCCGSTLNALNMAAIDKYISIHLMLWFNNCRGNGLQHTNGFQYILCCGSTKKCRKTQNGWEKFQYILCCGSTVPKITDMVGKVVFQYILCCGSTLMFYYSPTLIPDFNTSYVVVQLGAYLSAYLTDVFQYILCCGSTQPQHHFFLHIALISIHLMLWFNNL